MKITKHILVEGRVDWSDEFDCQMFGLFTEDQWESLKKAVKHYFKKNKDEISIGFGTNEQLTFDSYKSWIGNFTVTPDVTEKEASVIINLFRHDREDGPLLFGTGSGCLDADRFREEDENDEYE